MQARDLIRQNKTYETVQGYLVEGFISTATWGIYSLIWGISAPRFTGLWGQKQTQIYNAEGLEALTRLGLKAKRIIRKA